MLPIIFLVALIGRPLVANSPTIPLGNELCLIQGNSGVAQTSITSVKSVVLSNLNKTDPDGTNTPPSQIADLLKELIQCESGWNETICGDKNTSCGVLQFKEKTFLTYCEGQWLNSQDQILCAEKMITNGLGKQHWTNCWIKMNLDKYF